MAADVSIIVETNAKEVGNEFTGMAGQILATKAKAERFTSAFKFLDKAMNSGKIDAQQYSKAVLQLDKAQDELYSSIGRVNSAVKTQNSVMSGTSNTMSQAAINAEKLVEAQRRTGRSANRSGMLMQQAGYQIGDFIVQVQSGTNAFVAFGQQATQMAGLLGVLSSRLIPLSLILSVTIPLFTAIGATISRTSEDTTKLSFDFQRFGQDVIRGLEPLKPAFQAVASAFKFLKELLISGVNLIINAFRLLGVFIGTIPDAFSAGFAQVSRLMTVFELKTRSTVKSVMSMWQAMKDFISGSTATTMVTDVGPSGDVIQSQESVVDFYKSQAAALSSQASQLQETMKNAPTSSSLFSSALSGFQPIDIRDYFSRVSGEEGSSSSGGGTKDSMKTFMQLLDKLKGETANQEKLLGVYGEKREVLEQVISFEDELKRKLTETEVLKLEQAAREKYRIEERGQLLETMTSNIKSAFMSVVDGSKSVVDAFRSMLRSIILAVYEQKVAQPAANAIGSLIDKGISAIFSANGNVFNQGTHVKAYADGGVVSRATAFPMRGGVGVMGEAGPEAIMPLKRGKNGKLGVQMENSGGGAVTIHQSFNFSANGDESVKRIIRGEVPRITEATKAAVLDAKRRGGSYGRAF